MTKVIDEKGHFKRYEYDELNRPVREYNTVDELVWVRRYNYLGLVDEILDGKGNSLVSYKYNSEGRLIKEMDSEGQWTAYDYNSRGLVSRVNKGGFITRLFYDRNGRLHITAKGKDRDVETDFDNNYFYNPQGRLTALENKQGVIISAVLQTAGGR